MASSASNHNALIKQIRELSKEEFLLVMKEVAKTTMYPDTNKEIINAFSKSRARGKQFGGGNGSQSKTEPRPPLESSKSAWQCPTIFRGDLVPVNDFVSIDVEKISLKKGYNPGFPVKTKNRHLLVGANVSVVDYHKTLLLWAFIKYDINEVCQYNTKLNRLDNFKVSQGISLASVHAMLDIVFKNNILVGHSVDDDLKSLNYTFKGQRIIELGEFFHDEKKQKYKLKDIYAYFKENGSFQEEEHSSAKDARATMECYIQMEYLRTQGIWTGTELPIKRSSKEHIYFERCMCEK